MSIYDLSIDEVRHYLELNNWQKREGGDIGALWANVNREQKESTIAVPSAFEPDVFFWQGVVKRLALFESRTTESVAFRIKNPLVDIVRFRASNDLVIQETIPLIAGVGMVGAAHKLVRASATTARRPRSQIAGGFSKLGDEIVSRVRLGQTERGSYILPILVPLSSPVEQEVNRPDPHLLEIHRVPSEPEERRVTRTLAQALQAIHLIVVEPGTAPRMADMPHLIMAGVSRELIVAVNEVLMETTVSNLDAYFDWAPEITPPSGTAHEISIPSAASELLTRTAELLRVTTNEPNQSISGPIVEIRYEPSAPFGEIALQTMRRGRMVEVRVTLREQQIHSALEWMNTSRAVLVDGQIRKIPGRRLQIVNPSRVVPLDSEYLSQ